MANKKKLTSVQSQLEITIKLFDLFKHIYDCLEAYAADRLQPIEEQLKEISTGLHVLAQEAEAIEVVQNPVLNNMAINREIIIQISLSNQLASLTQARNHLQSLEGHLANYSNFLAMVSKLPSTTDSTIQSKLQSIKHGLEKADRQVSVLMNQSSTLYSSNTNELAQEERDEPKAKRMCYDRT